MAKRQTKGVTSRKDLRTVRKQIDTRHAKPATRTRGIKKGQSIGSTKRTRNTLDVLADRRSPRGPFQWTTDRDRELEEHFDANPRKAIAAFAFRFGVKRGEVKRHAIELGLLSSTATAASRGRVTKTEPGRTAAAEPRERDSATAAADRHEPAADSSPKAKREKPTIVVACPKGDERLTIQRKGRRSFTVLEGAQPDHSYGIGTHGLPICPQHSVEMIAAEPIDAAEAMRQVQGTTSQQSALFELDREFNFEGAWMAIEQMDEDLDTLQDAFDLALREVKKQRKDLDTLRASRRAAVKEFKKRRIAKAAHVAERQAQTATRADARCAFEQHIGTDCPLCHATSVALAIAAVAGTETAYRDRWSEAHRATAVRANSIDAARLSDLSSAAVVRALPLAGLHGLYLADVETWTSDEVLAVLRWVEGDQASDAPAVLGLPHHAAPEGEELQACADCGAILVNLNEGGVTFPAGSLVGRFCSRTPQAPIGTEVAEAAASV